MSGRRAWLVLGALVVLTALLILVSGSRPGGPSPDHESTSDAQDGTSALRLYAQSLNHPTGAIEGDFQLPAATGLLFVFSPLSQSGYSAAQATQVVNWLSSGGILVYAAESGDPQLDLALSLQRRLQRVDAIGRVGVPVFGGLQRIQGAPQASPFQVLPQQVPWLRNGRGDVLAVTFAIGRGRAVALADPLPLCNGFLLQADNGRLAADLLALAPPGSRVLFDEFHHGLASPSSSATAWATTSWGGALVWAVVILIAGLGLRGRAFGPPLTLGPVADRSSAEYATAVGGLLRRSAARIVTLETIDAATRRILGERLGLGGDVRSATFRDAVARRAPSTGTRLTQLEAEIVPGSQSDAALLQVAHRLHQLAFPPPDPAKRRSA
ncbi:MAG TPA: DUF4350 domain-containing protein [Candidatus Limnocylindrales bacterium]|nr:DUF4350 domain-containing protein [Candidatus Limnocylindrales bacterium]